MSTVPILREAVLSRKQKLKHLEGEAKGRKQGSSCLLEQRTVGLALAAWPEIRSSASEAWENALVSSCSRGKQIVGVNTQMLLVC